MSIFRFIFLFIPSLLIAQQATVKVAMDTSFIRIGETTNLSIEVKTSLSDTVQWPMFLDTLSDGVEILEISSIDTNTTNESLIYSQTMIISAYDSGEYIIHPRIFVVSGDTILSPALLLSANYAVLDSANTIRDIKAPFKAPLSFREIWPWISLVLLLLALIYLAYYIYQKKKNGIPLIQEKPKEAPHVIALRELDALNDMKLWQKGEIKTYYIRLSEIIRSYLEMRYGFPALEQVRSEIIDQLKAGSDFPRTMIIVVDEFLQEADLVKFAKLIPGIEIHEKVMKQAYEIVLKTKPELHLIDESQLSSVITKDKTDLS